MCVFHCRPLILGHVQPPRWVSADTISLVCWLDVTCVCVRVYMRGCTCVYAWVYVCVYEAGAHASLCQPTFSNSTGYLPTFSSSTGSPNWIEFSRVRMYSPPSDNLMTCGGEQINRRADITIKMGMSPFALHAHSEVFFELLPE